MRARSSAQSALTKKQQAVFAFIVKVVSETGKAPTYRAIAAKFKININGVAWHLKALESKERLSRFDGKIRINGRMVS